MFICEKKLDKNNELKSNIWQDVVAYLAYGTECKCCLGHRMLIALAAGILIGWVIF
jgi:hypothetical protein